jgi:uncharacterized alkaline shock family protein YloU
MDGQATISSDVLASYAADAACEVEGVVGLASSSLPLRRGVRVLIEETAVRVELHLRVEWGASIPQIGRAVQERVREYLERMADVRDARVDVVVDEVG